MKKHLEVIVLAAVLAVLLAAAVFGYRYFSENFNIEIPKPQPEPGVSATESVESLPPEAQKDIAEKDEPTAVPAPDFTVYDAEGNQVKLSDKKGKPVVVNFWASWCGPCKMEMPSFEQAYIQYGDRIEFMMVNLTDGRRETVEKASEFIEKSEYTFPVYFDKDINAAYTYQTTSIPQTLFVDSDGNAVILYIGMIPEEALNSQIEELLK